MTSKQNTASWEQNVSRETFLKLQQYVALLQKWNKAINLVGRSTEREIWDRHITDSAQLLPLIPEGISSLADFGSGAGLPGLVIAICRPEIAVTLVEQDQRKAAFLQECVGLLALQNATVANADIATVSGPFGMITARALASLKELLAMAYPRLQQGATCLFPKGRNFANELTEAQQEWAFTHQTTPSITDSQAAILLISGLSPKG